MHLQLCALPWLRTHSLRTVFHSPRIVFPAPWRPVQSESLNVKKSKVSQNQGLREDCRDRQDLAYGASKHEIAASSDALILFRSSHIPKNHVLNALSPIRTEPSIFEFCTISR